MTPSRRRGRRAVAVALAVVAALAWAPRADAYCRTTTCVGRCNTDENNCKTTGNKLYWPSLCVGWSYNVNGSANLPAVAARNAVIQAFEQWSDAQCTGELEFASLTLEEQSDAICDDFQFNQTGGNASVVGFKDSQWTFTSPYDTLATTKVSFDPNTGEILDADMMINTAYNDYTVSDDNPSYDLQALVTHEVGHFIGFDHSPLVDATMYASYTEGSLDWRNLHDDDLAGVCDIYPPRRRGLCNPQPYGGFLSTCTPPATASTSSCSIPIGAERAEAGSAGAMLLLATAMTALRRRRKKGSP